MRLFLTLIGLVIAVCSPSHDAIAQAPSASDDPLRHGHALLIGNFQYNDGRWPPLNVISLQLDALVKGLHYHFDSIQVETNLRADQMRHAIYSFLRNYGNDQSARLFIYYAGHGYTETIDQFGETRGYITGIDTPAIDQTSKGFDAARPKAIAMTEIRSAAEESVARSLLFIFDSCFGGTIFTNRGTIHASQAMSSDQIDKLMKAPARVVITAGRADEPVPADSPISGYFLAALNGAADRGHMGVVSAAEIYEYLYEKVVPMNIGLTPQFGRLPNPAFAEGDFLFRSPRTAESSRDTERLTGGNLRAFSILVSLKIVDRTGERTELTRRDWKRVTQSEWTEMYPGANPHYFDEVGRMSLGNCPGTVAREHTTPAHQVFFPDKGCKEMWFYVNDNNRGWGIASSITNIQ